MQTKQKLFLLDTSVIIDDIENLVKLYEEGENSLFISDIVFKELNNHKDKHDSNAAYGAREFFRSILTACALKEEETKKNIPEQVIEKSKKQTQDNFGKIVLEIGNAKVPLFVINREKYKEKAKDKNYIDFDTTSNDSKIAIIAEDYGLTLITGDKAFWVHGRINKIESEYLKNNAVAKPDELEFIFNAKVSKNSEHKKSIPFTEITDIKSISEEGEKNILSEEVSQFQCFILHLTNNDGLETGKKIFGILFAASIEIVSFDDKDEACIYKNYPIQPINLEQKFYLYLLRDKRISIVTAAGSTGSGKTLLALLEAIQAVQNEEYEGIIYTRNTVTASDKESEMGFRKGDDNQKLSLFLLPLFGTLNFIFEQLKNSSVSMKMENYDTKESFLKEKQTEEMMQKFNIKVIDPASMRGMTIPSNHFVIIDEFQNNTIKTAKLMGTRIGDGDKLVILGDIKQVDHSYLTKERNALTKMLHLAYTSGFVAGVKMKHTVRSKIAEFFDANF